MYLNPTALIRPELSAVVEEAAFADNYFIGLQVFPVYNSERDTGEYYKITKSASELQKKNVTERAAKSPYGKVDRTFEKDSFTCKDRGIEEDLDDTVTAKLANFFSTEQVTSRLLLRSIMLDHEARVAAEVFNASNFDANNAAVAYTEANLATINFPLDLQNAIKLVKKRGEMVNAVIMNRDVFDRVRRSTLLSSFLFGPLGGGQQVTQEMLAKAFGVERLLIADATVDTSKKGQTAAAGYIWGSNYVWVGNIQGGDFAAGGAGRTIVWTGDASSTFVTETYRKEDIRCDCIRVRTHTTEKVISAPSGTLITTNYA
jgi:hypothetical protein